MGGAAFGTLVGRGQLAPNAGGDYRARSGLAGSRSCVRSTRALIEGGAFGGPLAATSGPAQLGCPTGVTLLWPSGYLPISPPWAGFSGQKQLQQFLLVHPDQLGGLRHRPSIHSRCPGVGFHPRPGLVWVLRRQNFFQHHPGVPLAFIVSLSPPVDPIPVLAGTRRHPLPTLLRLGETTRTASSATRTFLAPRPSSTCQSLAQKNHPKPP